MNKNGKLPLQLLLIEILIILGVHLFNLGSLDAFFLSEDELGYWGNAAFFLGKDWGNAVSTCAYYSYGYSFFLMLIMSMPVSAIVMYRLAIIANALFMVASFFISYYLFTKLLPNRNRILISVACTAMAVYASYVSNSSIAWSECYLFFFAWLILLQAHFISQKTTILRICVFAVELGYIYMIHQRTIPFLIGGILYVLILWLDKKATVKHMITLILTDAGLLVIASVVKSILQDSIYGSGRMGNDYSTVMAGMNLSNLMIPVVREAMGQFFYLWAASFGLIPLGIGITVATLINKWKEKREDCYFFGFVLVVFLGVLGVSSIFMRLGVDRVDQLIYGRYNEIMIGFFVIMGILGLEDFVKQKNSWWILCIASAFCFCLALFLVNKIQSWNISLDTYYQGVCAAGTFWFYQLRGFRILEICGVVLGIQTLLFILTKYLLKKNWIFVAEILFIAIFWIISGQMVIQKQIIPYQLVNNLDLVRNDSLWKYIRDNDVSVAFLSNTRYSIRGNLQFYMLDQPLECVKNIEDLKGQPDILIVDNDDSIISSDLEKYRFIGFLGRKSVYTSNNINLEGLKKDLNANVFVHNDLAVEEEGYVIYGPYVVLPPGVYEFTFEMEKETVQVTPLGIMEIISNGSMLSSVPWNGEESSVTIRVQMEGDINTIECRYFKNAGNDTRPISVLVEPVGQD